MTEDQIDDLVDEWHRGAFLEGVSLQAALGQTDDEHSEWVLTGKSDLLKSGGLLNKQQRSAFVEELKKPCPFCGGPLGSCVMCGLGEGGTTCPS